MKHLLKKGKVSKLLPKDKSGGRSKEVHLVRYLGRKYIVRKCKTKERADTFERITNKFEKYGFLPKYLGRYRNNLFFEYIKGRDLTFEDMKYAGQIGKLYGYINREKLKNKEKFDFNLKFFTKLDFLLERRVINKEDYDLITKKFRELNKKVKLKFGFDLGDIMPNNFRLDKKKVYCVDIEGINENRIIGTGFGKAFLKWFKTKKQRKEFLKGYNSVYSSGYLTKDYLQFIYLFFLITNTASKINNKLDYSVNLIKLDKLLKGKLE